MIRYSAYLVKLIFGCTGTIFFFLKYTVPILKEVTAVCTIHKMTAKMKI